MAEADEVDAAERLIRGGGAGIQGESPFDRGQRLFLAPQGKENGSAGTMGLDEVGPEDEGPIQARAGSLVELRHAEVVSLQLVRQTPLRVGAGVVRIERDGAFEVQDRAVEGVGAFRSEID